MALLIALLVGSAIGAASGFLLQENFDLLLMNILMGIVGAVLADAIYYFATAGNQLFLFSLAGFLSQVVGALLLVLIFSLLHRATPEKISQKNGEE